MERIERERESNYQARIGHWEDEVKSWESAGKNGKKPQKPRRNVGTEAKSREGDAPLVALGDLIEEPRYGTSKKCSYETGKYGVLRIPNIIDGEVN
ncbi:MAG: hypothetical protein CL885_02810, partial [Dehalococcoidia bacterium]|nr:hypothetical protein [Dehalococcoidia bacterium]